MTSVGYFASGTATPNGMTTAADPMPAPAKRVASTVVATKRTYGPIKNFKPNNVGNYPGYKAPKPLPRALTPDERYDYLRALYSLLGGRAYAPAR